MHNILIVDDESGIRESLKGVLEDEGYKTCARRQRREPASTCCATAAFDVVLLDIWLPGMDGSKRWSKIGSWTIAPEVIMISGHGTIETAVRATKLGAFDFLEKPLSLEKTLILVKNAIEAKRLRSENRESEASNCRPRA